jgi:hypothetical protein
MREKRWGLIGVTCVTAASIALGALLFKFGNFSSVRCRNSSPYLIRGRPTGYSECANGVIHRPLQAKCPSFLPRSDEVLSSNAREKLHFPSDIRERLPQEPPPDASRDECRFDRDCTRAPHGYCVAPFRSSRPPRCAYGCVNDSECPQGICLCDDPVGRCVRAWCSDDAQCTGSSLCATYTDKSGCLSRTGFACQHSIDGCLVDSDCDAGACAWDASKHVRVCTRDVCYAP